MGGAGKTAIAERFLDATLDGTTKPEPHSVFVYSFYDDDKPENFFRHLQIWLEGTSAPEKEKSTTQLIFDIQQQRGLIILDGLEMLQESGVRGVFGRLTNPSLRDLLNHIACGSARELSVLATSRFPLTDLRDSQPRFFHTIAIEDIDVAAGVALLRDRGVRGTETQLASIVEHCGRHALTVDLAGGYIKEYGHGDPATPLNLGTTEELQAETEQEPDDNKRAVLKQGIRFARIAQRYREAMLNSDKAALALLERICLFRLGVDCETLAAIFTGPAAEKVSGRSLASLDAKQLQKKLDWLVRVGIVEVNGFQSPDAYTRRFTIHPAVRDGFLHGFGRDAVMESHEAIRVGIEKAIEDRDAGYWLLEDGGYVLTEDGDRVRLENKPGEQIPTDHETLDLFEEIIHHALQTGNATLAWDVYHKRMGGCRNLIAGLNDYGRAARITEQILKASAGGDILPDSVVAILRSDHGYCCLELGKLVAAKQSLLRGLDACQKTKNENLKTLSRNLACAFAESGNLERAQHTLQTSLPYLRNPEVVLKALIHIARIETLRGNVQITITASDITEHITNPLPGTLLASLPVTIRHDSLDLHRHLDEFKRQVETMSGQFDAGHSALAEARLDLCDRLLWHGDIVGASEQVSMSHEWAVARDARRFVCHCGLARAKIALSVMHGQLSALQEDRTDDLAVAETAIIQGLKIARASGFGLYHIDLLLERARLHLLRGAAGAALDNIELALDTGIPANDETGQPELLAANDESCGYAWGIVEGLHLRGEALLLQAAQLLYSDSFEPGELDRLPSEFGELRAQAEGCLDNAMNRWHDLRDPEPTEDNNFVHPESGIEYNYRAAETYRALNDLSGGILTRYPLSPIDETPEATANLPADPDTESEQTMTKRFGVALSFPGEHRAFVEQVANNLTSTLTKERVFYDRYYEAELSRPNLDTYLQGIYHDDTELVVVVLCKEYDEKEWCGLEFRAIRDLIKKRRDDEIMFVRVADGDVKGVFGIDGYVDAKNRQPSEIAQLICDRLAMVQSANP